MLIRSIKLTGREFDTFSLTSDQLLPEIDAQRNKEF